MEKERIYELRIDDEDPISGVDQISLVDEPAIEVNWIAFNKHKHSDQCFHIPDNEDEKYLQMLMDKAELEEHLFMEGYVVDSVEILDGKEGFATNPNAESDWDEDEFKIRYKYMLNPRITGQASVISTTRQFCRDLVNKNYVWRVEEMDSLTNEFGESALVWRGGYNCRHVWGKIRYRKDATIINKASVNKGKATDGGFPSGLAPDLDVIGYEQPNTVTNTVIRSVQEGTAKPSTIRNLGLSKEKEDMGYDNVLPPYSDPGIETGKTEFESYTDYPEAAKNAAKRALDWAEKNGWGSCGTAVGKARANQLAKGEPISEETISRMASFARHRQNKDVPYSEGCGGLMWDAWGGTAGIEWAQNKLDQIEKEKMSTQQFAADDEKRIVLGPAMIPNLKIFRKDALGNPYYVFFSADTIKMIADKYMRNKYTDNNDEMHNGKPVKDVYVYESWIKESYEDKSNKFGYQHLPIGTWFVSMKIRNNDTWNKVKKGELKGFSVSGYFEEIAQFAMEEMFLKQVAEILSKIKD